MRQEEYKRMPYAHNLVERVAREFVSQHLFGSSRVAEQQIMCSRDCIEIGDRLDIPSYDVLTHA